MSKIRVLVIDDSALMRQMITELLSAQPDIEVVDVASDPYKAREKILEHEPDVLTLDVEMPRMDGLTFLGKLMRSRPMPVVMVSSLTEKGCDTTLKALEFGAVDFVTKPRIDVSDGMAEIGSEIVDKVRIASRATVRRIAPPVAASADTETTQEALITSTHKMVAIGASTGGTQALAQILPTFPANAPGTVIVVHMPAGFTGRFAKRLDEICQMRVHEAKDNNPILPGHILLAPGSKHMSVRRNGARYLVKIDDSPPVNQFKPSVDVLFNSVAKYVGSNAVGAVLTGMGNDGAAGLLNMKNAGAETIAQDESTSVVYGMPREAFELGAVDAVLPLPKIGPEILKRVRKMAEAVTT
ncbi:MAG: chemotaxis response regulator protein-glutamate methylesterase [Pirellulaceae bacterium]